MNTNSILAESYEQLADFKAKFTFFNSANNALVEKIASGEKNLTDTELKGIYLIEWDLEKDVESILLKLEKLL